MFRKCPMWVLSHTRNAIFCQIQNWRGPVPKITKVRPAPNYEVWSILHPILYQHCRLSSYLVSNLSWVPIQEQKTMGCLVCVQNACQTCLLVGLKILSSNRRKRTSMLIRVGFRFLHPSQDMAHNWWKQVNRTDQIEEDAAIELIE